MEELYRIILLNTLQELPDADLVLNTLKLSLMTWKFAYFLARITPPELLDKGDQLLTALN